MKDQYFGDKSDYLKYALLRHIQKETALKLFVAWYLTPDDNGNDGNFTEYLNHPEVWEKFDPELYALLKKAFESHPRRSVSIIENASWLKDAAFFSAYVEQANDKRDGWFSRLLHDAKTSDLVFVDPDNGILPQSVKPGRKASPKFIYKEELQKLYEEGKSILIYQHFRRENRDQFIERFLTELKDQLGCNHTRGVRTPHVAFFCCAQDKHEQLVEAIDAIKQTPLIGKMSIYR